VNRAAVRWALGGLVLLGLFITFLFLAGGGGGLRQELDQVSVADVLAGGPGSYGDRELRIIGWYAELDADCKGSDGAEAGDVAWLARDCPLRVLLPEQPSEAVTQGELEAAGLRIGAPTNAVFPSRAEPGGPNLRLQQLVFVGRFDDPAAAACPTELRDRCLSTLVVTDYDGFLR
jgi:hypothetical protein